MAGPYEPEPDPNFDYDMVVIGGGSGGVRASRMASVHTAPKSSYWKATANTALPIIPPLEEPASMSDAFPKINGIREQISIRH